jgi:hypothetical protein
MPRARASSLRRLPDGSLLDNRLLAALLPRHPRAFRASRTVTQRSRMDSLALATLVATIVRRCRRRCGSGRKPSGFRRSRRP